MDDGFGAILRSLQIRSAYRHRYAMPAHSAARPGPSPDQLEAGTPGYRRANLAMFVGGFATFAMVYSTQPLLPLLAAEAELKALALRRIGTCAPLLVDRGGFLQVAIVAVL